MINSSALVLLLSSVLSSPLAPQWKSKCAISTPTIGGEYAMASSPDGLYIMGGRGHVPVSEYRVRDNTWRTRSAPPIELHHFQAQRLGDTVYVLGAFTGDYPTDKPVEHVYTYNVTTDTWQKGPAIPKSRQRGASALVTYQNKLYLIGGIKNGHLNQTVAYFDEYDPKTQRWRVLEDAPNPRDHHQAAVVGDKIVVAGGRLSRMDKQEPYRNTVAVTNIYDFRTATWKVGAPIPTARSGLSVLPNSNGEIIAMGGESKPFQTENKRVHNEVEIYNISTNSWRRSSSLLTPQHGFQAGHIDKVVYLAVPYGPCAAIETGVIK